MERYRQLLSKKKPAEKPKASSLKIPRQIGLVNNSSAILELLLGAGGVR
jgi:hypothetical protein